MAAVNRCRMASELEAEVDGSLAESVGGTKSLTVSKDVVEDFQANHKHEVATTYTSKANEIQIEADVWLCYVKRMMSKPGCGVAAASR